MFNNNINKVFLMGRVGKTPELNYTKNGIAFTTITLAINENIKNKDNLFEKKTTWFRITCYDYIAEQTTNYVLKGMLIYIEGTIKNETWKIENEEKSFFKIIAKNIQIIDKNKKTQEPQEETFKEELFFDDKTPF